MAVSLRPLVFCTALAGALSPFAAPALAQVTTSGERIQYALIAAKDYAFEAPTSINEGIVTFHLLNQGNDVHQLSLVELGVGHTIKQFFDAMRAKGVPPAWTVTVGMTPTIQPNSEAFLTVRLAPARYILSCMIPAKDGRSHVEKGMYQLVTIVPRPKAATTPTAKKP